MDSGKPGLVFLASAQDGKVSMVCFVQESLTKQGLSAGELVKQAALICDGKGGGRPNFAQAGAKNAEKLAEALSAVRKQVQSAQLPA
jgi:alanyl-tRNA synthetase